MGRGHRRHRDRRAPGRAAVVGRHQHHVVQRPRPSPPVTRHRGGRRPHPATPQAPPRRRGTDPAGRRRRAARRAGQVPPASVERAKYTSGCPVAEVHPDGVNRVPHDPHRRRAGALHEGELDGLRAVAVDPRRNAPREPAPIRGRHQDLFGVGTGQDGRQFAVRVHRGRGRGRAAGRQRRNAGSARRRSERRSGRAAVVERTGKRMASLLRQEEGGRPRRKGPSQSRLGSPQRGVLVVGFDSAARRA